MEYFFLVWKRVGECIEYTVLVPPNGKAILSFNQPVTTCITKIGKTFLESANRLKNIHQNKDRHLEAGKYNFVIPQYFFSTFKIHFKSHDEIYFFY